MSRHNYTDEPEDNWSLIRWRGAVASAIRGARGQALLREMLAALEAMPDRRLIAHNLQRDGEHCALGVVGAARGLDMSGLDPEEYGAVAKAFGVSIALVREIEYENDDIIEDETMRVVELHGPPTRRWPDHGRPLSACVWENDPLAPRLRWQHMRQWIIENLVVDGADKGRDTST